MVLYFFLGLFCAWREEIKILVMVMVMIKYLVLVVCEFFGSIIMSNKLKKGTNKYRNLWTHFIISESSISSSDSVDGSSSGS